MKSRPALLAFVAFTILGCVSIPSEAPELSVALGQRLTALENANITLLQRYFDLKRHEIDRFITEVWVPRFARNIFSRADVAAEWRRIVASGSDADRLEFLVNAGPALQQEINKKRIELVAPLDDLERRVRQNIESEYDQAAAINNTLTSFLTSAADVAENRNRYLEAVGVTEDKVSAVIDGVDSAVASLLTNAGEATSYLNKLEQLKTLISGN